MKWAFLFVTAIGLCFAGKAVIDLVKIFSCKKAVDAYYMEKRKVHVGRGYTLYCTFSYRYEGKDYYTETKLGVTQKLVDYLQQGSKYTIYINENKPERFVVERKVTSNEIITIICGVFVACLPFFIFFGLSF